MSFINHFSNPLVSGVSVSKDVGHYTLCCAKLGEQMSISLSSSSVPQATWSLTHICCIWMLQDTPTQYTHTYSLTDACRNKHMYTQPQDSLIYFICSHTNVCIVFYVQMVIFLALKETLIFSWYLHGWHLFIIYMLFKKIIQNINLRIQSSLNLPG